MQDLVFWVDFYIIWKRPVFVYWCWDQSGLYGALKKSSVPGHHDGPARLDGLDVLRLVVYSQEFLSCHVFLCWAATAAYSCYWQGLWCVVPVPRASRAAPRISASSHSQVITWHSSFIICPQGKTNKTTNRAFLYRYYIPTLEHLGAGSQSPCVYIRHH